MLIRAFMTEAVQKTIWTGGVVQMPVTSREKNTLQMQFMHDFKENTTSLIFK